MHLGRDPAHPFHPQRLFGLRFERRETERAYRRWRAETVTPFARIGYIGSAPSWILLLIAMIVLDPGAAQEAAVWVVLWIVLLVVLTALTIPPRLRPTVMPFAAAANCLAGFLVVWLTSAVALTGEVSQTRAGVMTAGMIVVMFFGFAVFRISPGVAMAAITPYAAFGSYQLLQGYNRQELNGVEAASLAAAQWIAYLGCLLVCIVIEIVERRAFCKDQIIEAQQKELRHSRETIRRYVPRAVFEHIVNGDTVGIDVPTRRRVTVLFADLVGFTDLADRVEAEILTQVVNDYMTTMSQLVDEHGGLVNEFAGDGLMALFGAPDEMVVEEQAVSAVAGGSGHAGSIPVTQHPVEPTRCDRADADADRHRHRRPERRQLRVRRADDVHRDRTAHQHRSPHPGAVRARPDPAERLQLAPDQGPDLLRAVRRGAVQGRALSGAGLLPVRGERLSPEDGHLNGAGDSASNPGTRMDAKSPPPPQCQAYETPVACSGQ